MQKMDETKAVTDEENAEVFCEHFSKLFNNQTPLPCDLTALDLVKQHADYTHLASPPSLQEVHAALRRMANGKAPGPSGITADALKSMVWTEDDTEEVVDNNDAESLAMTLHTMIVEF